MSDGYRRDVWAGGRKAIMQEMIRYYCANYSEDGQDGTEYDCKVIDTLKELGRGQTYGGIS